MAIVTVRPTAGNDGDGWTLVGATTRWEATSDNSDASYVYIGGLAGLFIVSVGDPAIPAGALIKQVRMRVRIAVVPGTTLQRLVSFYMRTDVSPQKVSWGPDTLISPSSSTPFELASGWFTQWIDVYGSPEPYLVSDMPNLSAGFQTEDNKDNDIRLYEMYMDVEYNLPPTGNLTAPTGVVSNTSQPLAEWTYSDPENDPQSRYHLVIESGNTSANGAPLLDGSEQYNTGEVASSATSASLPALANGTYTLWLRVRQSDVSGQVQRSTWDSIVYTLDVTPPGTPTLTITEQPDQARAKLVADSNSPAGDEADAYDFQWSTDGVNWSAVRGGTDTPTDSGAIDTPATIYDYEAAPNKLIYYRARAIRYGLSEDDRIVSSWSTAGTAVLQQDEWWLKDLEDSTKNIIVQPNGDKIDYAKPRDTTFFKPLGRETSIAVKDVQRAEQFRLNLDTLSIEDHDAMEAIIKSSIQHTLLLQSPFESGKQWYVEIDSVSKTMLNVATPWYQFTTEFIEVSRP